MSSPIRLLRNEPWGATAALYAWAIAVVLTALIEPGTLLFVAPPAIVATAPLLTPRQHRPLATIIAVALLVGWGILGFVQLGGYFLPSAVLLGTGYLRARAPRFR